MSSENSTQLICHRITPTEPDPETLRELKELSASVFKPYFPGTEHTHPSFDLAEWQHRITLPNAIIFYVTTATSARPLGFFNAIPLIQPEIGYEILHIWLVAVDPESRGLGIFRLLLNRMKQHARSCGYRELTVCTRPENFGKMYRLLSENGWEEVAWREKESGGKQVLMKIAI